MEQTQAERLKETMGRLRLDRTAMARYLGVPHGTLSNWLNGVTSPSSSVTRLLDVLGTLEVIAPNIHAGFIPAPAIDRRFK